MKVLLFDKALAAADAVVAAMKAEQIGLPTPFEGLTVGEVLNDMTMQLALLPKIVVNETVQPNDLQQIDRLGGNLQRSWRAHAETEARNGRAADGPLRFLRRDGDPFHRAGFGDCPLQACANSALPGAFSGRSGACALCRLPGWQLRSESEPSFAPRISKVPAG